jgi:hypothetical protein
VEAVAVLLPLEATVLEAVQLRKLAGTGAQELRHQLVVVA